MKPLGVVEDHVVVDGVFCACVIGEMLYLSFGLQAAEEALDDSVVPAVAASAHALNKATALQEGLERRAGVLDTLIGVEHHVSRPAARLPGAIQRSDDQIGVRTP